MKEIKEIDWLIYFYFWEILFSVETQDEILLQYQTSVWHRMSARLKNKIKNNLTWEGAFYESE